MELSDREKDMLQGLSGVTKSALALVPGLGPALAGWEAYQKSRFERKVRDVIEELQAKVGDLASFFSDSWLKTEEGQQFARKVFDSAFDDQLSDKQELFVNALVNGVREKEIDILVKLKFVDMLRQMSLSSLLVLSEMHNMFKDQVRGPDRSPDPLSSLPHVDTEKIAEKLSDKFEPYLVIAAISEMEAQGLFSKIGEWFEQPDGSYMRGVGFATEPSYTDFTARFVEFITEKQF